MQEIVFKMRAILFHLQAVIHNVGLFFIFKDEKIKELKPFGL